MPRSYYSKTAVGQKHSIMTRPTAGLDAYEDPTTITDNNLSDCFNVLPYKNEILEFYENVYADSGDAVGTNLDDGYIRFIMPYETEETTHAAIVYDGVASDYYLKILNINDGENTVSAVFDIASASFLFESFADDIFSGCVFNTENKFYAVLSCENSKKLLWCDGSEIGTVELPFYPIKLVSHVNRVFAIDDGNKLWWCRAGDLNTWYGLEQDDDYIVTSTNCKNGSFTIANQPDVPRPIMATLTGVAGSDTYGNLTVVGTARDGSAQTKVYSPVVGVNIFPDTWKSITSITQSGWSATSTADAIKIGIAAIGTGYVQEDQGYWTIEKEYELRNMVVIGNSLYIFSKQSIYVFSGYSPDTFSLQTMIPDLGMSYQRSTAMYQLVTANNVAYFLSNGNVYEFNGSDMPRIISHATVVNGSVSNNIYSGIPESPFNSFDSSRIEATTSHLYLYNRYIDSDSIVYSFDIKARSWWIQKPINEVQLPNEGYYILLSDRSHTQLLGFTQDFSNNVFDYFRNPLRVHYDGLNPYITTKAFTSNPSEDGTLTGIVLTVSAYKETTANINLYFSLNSQDVTDDGTDFTLIESQSVDFTGSMQRVIFNLPVSLVARTLAYRLKIEVELPYVETYYESVYLYNLERVHRIMGRSR